MVALVLGVTLERQSTGFLWHTSHHGLQSHAISWFIGHQNLQSRAISHFACHRDSQCHLQTM